MKKIIVYTSLFLLSLALFAQEERAELFEKSLFKIAYDFHWHQKVARFIGPDDAEDLKKIYRASLGFYYPFHRFFQLGISLDYTILLSHREKNLSLSLIKEKAKISTQVLGLTTHLKPQLPFSWSRWDGIVYFDAGLGLGTTNPISFGTQPIANFEYKGTRTMPTPFPLAFESTPKIGVQGFVGRFLGFEVASGYRMLWILHPMVSVPNPDSNGPTTDKKVVWYDVTAPFIEASVNFAF